MQKPGRCWGAELRPSTLGSWPANLKLTERMTAFKLRSRSKTLVLDPPRLLGVVNVTPDSFSGDGLHGSPEKAVAQALAMLEAGADLLDLGGESTGPGSDEVSQDDELERVLPVLRALREKTEAWISVDTYKAEVARQALDAGADAINDVTALRGDSEMAGVIAEAGVPAFLMYAKDASPRTTTTLVEYDNVVEAVRDFFEERLAFAESAGIPRSQLVLDPGMGMFVSADSSYSFELVRRLTELAELGCGLLVGPSRKSFLAKVSPGRTLSVQERLIPGLTTAALAVQNGAHLVRMHDVPEARLMLDTLQHLSGIRA